MGIIEIGFGCRPVRLASQAKRETHEQGGSRADFRGHPGTGAALDQLHNTVSLPFEAGENRTVPVKIVDDRGIESLKVLPISE